MLTPMIRECPQCGGMINVEHSAHEDLGAQYEITYLYCDHCQIGLETLWEKHGEQSEEKVTARFEADREPIKLGKFLQRLQDARAA